MTTRLFLSASIAVLVTGTVSSVAAAPSPLDAWRRMFEPPIRHAMRWHPPKYRTHKPVLVKAAPDEPPAPAPEAATLAPSDIPDAVLPIPEPRPADTPEASPPRLGARAPLDVPDAVLPIPEARPAQPPESAAMPPIPAGRPPAAGEAGAGLPQPKSGKAPTKLAALTPPAAPLDQKPVTGSDTALAALGVKSIPLDPIEKGPCTVLDPVQIASLESGAVPLSAKATLNSRMAETVARWVREDVMPAARDILGGELTGLRIFDSYNCRSRDNIAGAKISEHGFANAIDVAAFRIGKRWIEVGGDKHNAADDARFLDTVRHDACERFSTVLGPGEPYHSTHFHLDLGRHGKSGKYMICQ